MFADGKTELVDDRARVQTPIALRLRLDGAMDRAQPGTCTGVHDRLMKAHIQVKRAVWIRALGFSEFSKPFIEFAQFLGQGGPRLGLQLRTCAGCKPFQLANDPIELVSIVLRQRRDRQACFISAGRGNKDVAFLLQPVKSSSHGRPADAELVRKVRLDHAAPRRQLPMNNQVSNSPECALANGLSTESRVRGSSAFP